MCMISCAIVQGFCLLPTHCSTLTPSALRSLRLVFSDAGAAILLGAVDGISARRSASSAASGVWPGEQQGGWHGQPPAIFLQDLILCLLHPGGLPAACQGLIGAHPPSAPWISPAQKLALTTVSQVSGGSCALPGFSMSSFSPRTLVSWVGSSPVRPGLPAYRDLRRLVSGLHRLFQRQISSVEPPCWAFLNLE